MVRWAPAAKPNRSGLAQGNHLVVLPSVDPDHRRRGKDTVILDLLEKEAIGR